MSDSSSPSPVLSFFREILPIVSAFSTAPPFPSLSSQKINEISDLRNGVFVNCFLHWVSPSSVDLGDIELDASDPSGNLQIFLISLEGFYETLGKPLDSLNFSVNKILRDDTALHSALSFLLFAGINGERKEDCVGVIMEMTENQQTELMEIINTVNEQINANSEEKSSSSTATPTTRKLTGDLSSLSPLMSPSFSPSTPPKISVASAATEKLLAETQQKLIKAEEINTSLFSKINSLEGERKDLNRRISELTSEISRMASERSSAISDAVAEAVERENSKNSEIRKNEMKGLKSELNEWEAKWSDFKNENRRLIEVNGALQRERTAATDALEELKNQNNRLKDDFQIAQTKAEGLSAAEDKIKRLQQRLEAAGDVRQQVDEAEAEVTKHVEKIVHLESQLKESAQWKTQNAKLKEQVITLQSELVEQKISFENKISEVNELRSELAASERQMKATAEELKGVREEFERFKGNNRGGGEGLGIDLNGRDSMASLKEANKRLEFQLKQMESDKMKSSENDALQTDLDIQKKLSESLQSKLIESTRKVNALEAQLKKGGGEGGQLETLRKDLENANETIRSLQQQTAGAAVAGSSSTAGLSAANGALTASTDSLAIRNAKLEKFVKHQQKKQKLLEDAVEKLQSEVNPLREQLEKMKKILEERDNEIGELQTLRMEDQQIANRERRLMSSAFYSLGMDFQIALMTGKAATRAGIQSEKFQQKTLINQLRNSQNQRNIPLTPMKQSGQQTPQTTKTIAEEPK